MPTRKKKNTKNARYREGAKHYGVDAFVAYLEFERVRKTRGDLTPALLVEESKPKAAVLHNEFEWSNAKCGKLYRENQARTLMGAVIIDLPDLSGEPRSIRAVVHRNSQPHRYEPIEVVLQDRDARAELRGMYLKRLESLTREYQALVGVSEVYEFAKKKVKKAS